MSLTIPSSGGYLANDVANVPATTGDIISIGCWAKSSLGTRTEVMMSLGTDFSGVDGSIHIEGSTTVEMVGVTVVSSTKQGQAKHTATRDTDWHHYCMVYDFDSPQLKLYVDGVLRGTDNVISPKPTSELHKWRIGRRADLSATVDWEGQIAEAFIFDGDISLVTDMLTDLQTMQADAALPADKLLHYDSLYDGANGSDSQGGTLTASGTISYSAGTHPVTLATRKMMFRREWTGAEIATNADSEFVFPAHVSGANPPNVKGSSCIWDNLSPLITLQAWEKGLELPVLSAGDVSAASGKVYFTLDMDLTRNQSHNDPRWGISDGTIVHQMRRNNEGVGSGSGDSVTHVYASDAALVAQTITQDDYPGQGDPQPTDYPDAPYSVHKRFILTPDNVELHVDSLNWLVTTNTKTDYSDPALDMSADLSVVFSSDGDLINEYQIDNLIVQCWVESDVVVDINTGLVFHAKFDEASGTPVDTTGNTALTKVTGTGSITQNETSLLPTSEGKAISMTGDGRVNLDTPYEMAASSDFTIAFFVNLDSVLTLAYPLSGDSGLDGVGFFRGGADEIELRLGNNITSLATLPSALVVDTTYHIAVTRDGVSERVIVWVDGVPTVAAANSDGERNWWLGVIGGRDATGSDMNGTIDDVRLYSRILNMDEIGRLKDAQLSNVNLLVPSLLKPGLVSGGNLKPSLVTSSYSGGTPGDLEDIKPGLRSGDGLKPSLIDSDGNLKPSLLK